MSKKRSNQKPLGASLEWGLVGITLVVVSLGSMFYRSLVIASLFILLVGIVLVISSMNSFVIKAYQGLPHKKSAYYTGYAGALLLTLLLGIQSPQLPAKLYILGFGILLTFPALFKVFKD